jgi:hypothetical protein
MPLFQLNFARRVCAVVHSFFSVQGGRKDPPLPLLGAGEPGKQCCGSGLDPDLGGQK